MERNSTHPSIDDVRVGVASLGVVDANVVRSSESNPFVKSRTESQGDFSNYDPSQIHPKGRNPATGRSIDRFPIRTPTDVPGGCRDVAIVRFTAYKDAHVPLGDVGAGRGRRRGDGDGAEGGDGGHDVYSQSVCAGREGASARSKSLAFSILVFLLITSCVSPYCRGL
jgi:hypothetical protein